MAGVVCERVKVYCRLRPQLVAAAPEDDGSTFVTGGASHCDGGGTAVTIAAPESNPLPKRLVYKDTTAKDFEFDGCFRQDTTQDTVYASVASELVQSVLLGYNATIMAYGQTGSGKTHTMMGPNGDGPDRGVIPRCLQGLFTAPADSGLRFHLSFVQIYCERVLDLLSGLPTPLSIRESEDDGVFVDGVQKKHVHSVEECLHWIHVGNANRTVAATNMNAHSSRSHAVITIQVERIDAAQASSQVVQKSQLHLVDLAGSERVKKSLVRGSHVNELKAINLSLSALGNCISALSKQQSHVPYRDSKLTRLLQNSLGGNAKTALILAVTPEVSEAAESLATLQFGQRAMQIQVSAHVNVVPDYKRLVEMLQAKVDAYEDKLHGLDTELQASRDQQALLINQADEARLEASKIAFEMEALKTTTQLQIAMAKQTPAPQCAAAESDDAPDDTSPSSTDVFQAFETKLQALTAQHSAELHALKQRFDFQVETHKQIANRANQEWHNIEHELSSERTAHLETCHELRATKEKYFALESDSVDRISDVCNEKKELETQIALHTQTIQRLEHTIGDLRLQLEHAQSGRSELSASIDANFVSREQVNEMEALYSDAITKLQSRVESLEGQKTKKPTPPVLEAPKAPVTQVKKDSLIGKKAVPKIGRVMPGGRR
ncbi:hypothetical protein SPRG_08215 [Saprolegnia parasitica CBS 223.65]|uniref:Kinesin-like protein n=1 Tax=Saprolegnia parasitica (strain CBS 223.65) TaxID=695850 RepID=A0A067CHX1_SAPPC|nr:hypothetical protein SPRG_08215 [Saprolegnia parasitica CBS 223.65]KDO26412.1 hypothetical protein SPRG_08215 [Saprolegnia parasitica CBS 223.65]|eukprot:XP_012202849.1 hypothetical protein SPRG_08215 [Saprolegnia parasitica CBS 223.65]